MPSAATPCPRCGEPVDGHRFCEGCGHDLWLRRAGAAQPQEGPCPGCGADGGGNSYCGTCGLRRKDGTEHVEADLGGLAGVSDRGLVHARNEDAMALGALAAPAVSQALVAAVVCDGVSTVDSPELASRVAADTALLRLLGPGGPSMTEAVTEAAAAVSAVGSGDARAPACTLVSAFVRLLGDGRPEITVGWVGDSRAYWLAGPDAGEPARLLTLDHSWAVDMVTAGLLDEEAAMADPRAHAITRWLGPGGEPVPDVVTLRPAGPGLLLLCSDGLWNYRPDPADLSAIALPELTRAGPLAAARALTTVALDAGGRDNVTVVAMTVEPPTPPPVEQRSPS